MSQLGRIRAQMGAVSVWLMRSTFIRRSQEVACAYASFGSGGKEDGLEDPTVTKLRWYFLIS